MATITTLSGGRGWLRSDAAASIARIDKALGHRMQITSAGRSRAEQQRLYDLYLAGKGNYAAKPGTSPHESGYAIDSDEAQRYLLTMSRHGWSRPLKSEPWHFLYRASNDTYAGAPAGGTGMWDVEKRQRFLNQIGLDTGGVGNGWGPASDKALKTFQTWMGLDSDGDWGAKTQGAAEIIMAGKNFTNRPVKEIQAFLKAKGLYPGAIDNEWGNGSSMGTYRYQKSAGLTADAQWGAATDAKAFPVVVPPEPPKPVPGRNATSRPNKEIQAKVGAPQTGVWDLPTYNAVVAWQKANRLEADGVWGVSADGWAFPPAGSLAGVDYSFARPAPKDLYAAGFRHVGRYLFFEKYQDGYGKTSKGITASEYAALEAAGLAVWFIYEEDGKELLGGFEAGVRVAKAAEAHRLREGLPVKPIYFNVDFDAQPADYLKILAALDGVASVIGLSRVGLYAGMKVIKAAFDAKKILWGFQTYAWSGGQWDPRAQLQQWANGQWGGTVDFTRAMSAEYGQSRIPETPETPEIPATPDDAPVPRSELVELRSQIEAQQKALGVLAAIVTEWLS